MALSKELIKRQITELSKASDVLAYSLTKCSSLTLGNDMSPVDLESLEALTGRFARLSDLFIQKSLRLLDQFHLEDTGTVRDRINRAEKHGIVEKADDLVEIRLLRNEISHVYQEETWIQINRKVIALAPILLKNVDTLKQKLTAVMEEDELFPM
jgi:hypothetical protein